MKKILFAIVSLAALAMGCVKEQQPSETPAEANPVSTIRISVAPTKVAVNETTGACTWQENDQIAVWFANTDATAGQRVVYTFKTVLSDGSAEFETSETITEGYAPAKVTYPAECLNDEGGWGLIRNWEYKEGFIPMYARTETITVNDDGSLSAQLYHNASVFKFTLHDIPAYAAGFVLEAVKYNKNEAGEFVDADGNVIDKENATPSQTIAIKTSFPYKTGYTADPADNSNDITLYSVAAHGSYLTRVYLVDGDGSVIEGSEKKIKQSWNDVSTDDFIEFPRIDFKKADLRKDFVKVCGIKWAKGNLVFDKDGKFTTTNAAYQSGWGIYDEQWKCIHYDGSLSTDTGKYTNKNEYFDHFNYSGIGRRARFASVIMTSKTKKFEISGKVFAGYAPNEATVLDNMTQLSGDDRFISAEFGRDVLMTDGQELCGDVAFWATKGKYKLPTSTQLQAIGHPTNSAASYQFGYYMAGTVKVKGVLFTTPRGDVVRNTTSIEFTSADLESGLFLPMAGRRGPRNKVDTNGDGQADSYVADDGYNSEAIINVGSQGLYRCGTFGSLADGSHENSTVLIINGSELKYGYTNGSVLKDKDGKYVDNTMSNRAGGSIRPVLAE